MLSRPTRGPSRPGAILMVGLALLALFAVVGISFVYYSQSMSESSNDHLQTEDEGDRILPPDATEIFNKALSQMIYGPPQAATPGANNPGLRSHFMGHDLARSMYGLNLTDLNNQTPFNGYGEADVDLAASSIPAVQGFDSDTFVNFAFFEGDQFLRVPESRQFYEFNTATRVFTPVGPAGFVGRNVPWTAPGRLNLFLADLDENGQVTKPSYYDQDAFDPDGSAGPIGGTLGLAPSNPNWATGLGKYLILRPTQAEHPNFPQIPPNPDGSYTGDVQNLPFNGVQRNDSLWINPSLGTYRYRGRKVTPLVAPLVTDLDGRINLNMVGNVVRMGAHGSNQGWGRHTINPERVTAAGINVNALFNGNGTIPGRYGPDGNPVSPLAGATIPSGQTPHPYGQADFNGDATTPFMLPGGTANPAMNPFRPFPEFPAEYQNGLAGERDNHPLLYNPYFTIFDPRQLTNPASTNYDRSFAAGEVAHLNGWLNGSKFTGGLATRSKLAQLFTGLQADSYGTANPRLAITTVSNDIDVPGISPWIANPATNPLTIGTDGGDRPTSTPAPEDPNTATVGSGDFVGPNDWRFSPNLLSAIDLNRGLLDFRLDPTQPFSCRNIKDPLTAGDYVTAGTLGQVMADRQRFALEIFTRLSVATGQPSDPNVQRHLAQMAANIVDYIDNDPYSTPFVWTDNGAWISSDPMSPDPAPWMDVARFADPANNVVYGMEVPRLRLNEIYAEIRNDDMDPQPNNPPIDPTLVAKEPYEVNFWVELFNPLPDYVSAGTGYNQLQRNAAMSRSAVALYQQSPDGMGGWTPSPDKPIYKITITDPNTAATLTAATNVTGGPPPGVMPRVVMDNYSPFGMPTVGDPRLVECNNYAANPPADGTPAQNTNGYYVLGPDKNFPDSGMMMMPPMGATQPTLQVPTTMGMGMGMPGNGLSFTIPLTDPMPFTRRYDVFLQRLPISHLPGGDDPAALPFNQTFLTVDYVPGLQPNDGAEYDDNGDRSGGGMGGMGGYLPVDQRASRGLLQPYGFIGADPTAAEQTFPPQLRTVTVATEPKTTLFKRNRPDPMGGMGGGVPPEPTFYRWFPFLDRQVISPIELLHVPGFRHDIVMRRFHQGPAGGDDQLYDNHTVNWFDSRSRLYRALALLRCGDRVPELGIGTRVPGRININTVRSREVLRALLDAQSGNHFSDSDVDNMWTQIQSYRNMTGPFRGMAPPLLVDSMGMPDMDSGVNATVLRNAGNLFAPTAANEHAYIRYEALRKAYNNLTTRSNTFAVWMTVGLFEVDDAGRIGAEVYDDTPGDLRAKFFAVIDRTNLTQALDVTMTPPTRLPQQGQSPVTFYAPQAVTGAGATRPVAVRVPIPAATGIYDGKRYDFSSGSVTVTVGMGQNLETVTATVDTTSTPPELVFQAQNNHHWGIPVVTGVNGGPVVFGNPGPQETFDFRRPPFDGIVKYAIRLK